MATADQVSVLFTVGSSATTCVITWNTNPTPGAKVLLALGINGTQTISSVVDNGSPARTFVQDAIQVGAANHNSYIFHGDDVRPPSGSGTYTITVTLSATTASVSGGAESYLGLVPGGPIAVTKNGATSTAPACPATTGYPGSAFFGTMQNSSSLNPETITIGGGFTEDLKNTNGVAAQCFSMGHFLDAVGTSQAISWTLGDSVAWSAAMAVFAPALPQARQITPGRTWLRRFGHSQRDFGPQGVSGPSTTITGLTAQVTVNAETGSVVTSVPFVPQALQPGQSWRRIFQHRQQTPTTAPSTTVVGLTAQVTVNAETGSVVTATPFVPQPLQAGLIWQRVFRHRQQPTTTAPSVTVPGLTAQVTVNAETGSIQTSVPFAPPALQPGPSWRRIFQHRQQPTTTAPSASIVGLTAQVTVNAETGAIQTSVPFVPQALQPGQSWRRIFRHRQQPPTSVSQSPSTTVTGLTAQVTVNAETGAVSTSTPFVPQALQPGQSWKRFFWHRQQLVTTAPSVAIAGLTAQVTINAETGSVVTTLPPPALQARPGRTWLRRFRRALTVPFGGSLAVRFNFCDLQLGGTVSGNAFGGTGTGNLYGGTATGNLYGGTATANLYGGTAVINNKYGGTATETNQYGGTETETNLYGGSITCPSN